MNKFLNRTHDPVCGMFLLKLDESLRSMFKGQNYYFCCEICKSEFERNPDTFVSANENDVTSQEEFSRKTYSLN